MEMKRFSFTGSKAMSFLENDRSTARANGTKCEIGESVKLK